MRNNIKFTITLAIIMIFIGLGFLSYNYINTKRELVFNTMNLVLSNDFILSDNIEDEVDVEV